MRPRDASVTYAMGRVHVAADRLPEARESFELLVEAAPGFKQGHVLLATVYYRLDERALGDQQRAIVEQLRAEEKEQQREDQDIGPTSFGDELGPSRLRVTTSRQGLSRGTQGARREHPERAGEPAPARSYSSPDSSPRSITKGTRAISVCRARRSSTLIGEDVGAVGEPLHGKDDAAHRSPRVGLDERRSDRR